MSDIIVESPAEQGSNFRAPLRRIAQAAAALVIFLAALLVFGRTPPVGNPGLEDHLFRLVSFATLTVWIALIIGIRRRGTAAICALAIASLLELLILPATGGAYGALVSANLGIVIAYCGMQAYWYGIVNSRRVS